MMNVLDKPFYLIIKWPTGKIETLRYETSYYRDIDEEAVLTLRGIILCRGVDNE